MFVISSTKFPIKSFDCISDVIDFLQCYIPFDGNFLEQFIDFLVNRPLYSNYKFVIDDLVITVYILP